MKAVLRQVRGVPPCTGAQSKQTQGSGGNPSRPHAVRQHAAFAIGGVRQTWEGVLAGVGAARVVGVWGGEVVWSRRRRAPRPPPRAVCPGATLLTEEKQARRERRSELWPPVYARQKEGAPATDTKPHQIRLR